MVMWYLKMPLCDAALSLERGFLSGQRVVGQFQALPVSRVVAFAYGALSLRLGV